jgi:hypothetical protein
MNLGIRCVPEHGNLRHTKSPSAATSHNSHIAQGNDENDDGDGDDNNNLRGFTTYLHGCDCYIRRETTEVLQMTVKAQFNSHPGHVTSKQTVLGIHRTRGRVGSRTAKNALRVEGSLRPAGNRTTIPLSSSPQATQPVINRSTNVITLIRTAVQCHVRQILISATEWSATAGTVSSTQGFCSERMWPVALDTRWSRILISFRKWIGTDSSDASLLSGVLKMAHGSSTFSDWVRFIRNRIPPSLDVT